MYNIREWVALMMVVCSYLLGESGVTTSPPRSRSLPSFLWEKNPQHRTLNKGHLEDIKSGVFQRYLELVSFLYSEGHFSEVPLYLCRDVRESYCLVMEHQLFEREKI